MESLVTRLRKGPTWALLATLGIVYVFIELYYFYLPPTLITSLAEYGFADYLGYVYKMTLLTTLIWVSLNVLRGRVEPSDVSYSWLASGTLLTPVAIRMTLGIYAYTYYTLVFTLVALLLAVASLRRKEPRLPSYATLAAALAALPTIAYTTLNYNIWGRGDPGVDAAVAFLIIVPLTTVTAASSQGAPFRPLVVAFGLLSLATAGYGVISPTLLPGVLEEPLASSSVFVALASAFLVVGSVKVGSLEEKPRS